MERLTKWTNYCGLSVGDCIYGRWSCNENDCFDCERMNDMLSRLAKYEDSGLTPEEVVKMRDDMEKIRSCATCSHNYERCNPDGAEEQQDFYSECIRSINPRKGHWEWEGLANADG